MRTLALIAILAIPFVAFADTIVIRKVVRVVPVRSVILYTVGDTPEKTLTDEEAEKIAKHILKKLVENKVDLNLIDDNTTSKEPVEDSTEIDKQVFNIFNTNCIRCHKPGEVKKGIQLFTKDRKLFTKEDKKEEYKRRVKIANAVDVSEGGDMPLDGKPLTPGQLAIIRKWRDLVK